MEEHTFGAASDYASACTRVHKLVFVLTGFHAARDEAQYPLLAPRSPAVALPWQGGLTPGQLVPLGSHSAGRLSLGLGPEVLCHR